MSRHRTRAHPTACLGAGELSDNLPNQIKYPKTSEINRVSDFTGTGARVVINQPGAPMGRAYGTRRHGGKKR